jgi:hypothetical protein
LWNSGARLCRISIGDNRALEVYDLAGESSKLATPPDKETYCGSDGQKLIVRDYRSGHVSELDISSGEERTLASYTPSDRIPPHLSFFPDLKSVASNPALVLAAAAKDLQAIQVSSPNSEAVRGVRWSSNSSRFFVETARRGADVSGTVGNFRYPKSSNLVPGSAVRPDVSERMVCRSPIRPAGIRLIQRRIRGRLRLEAFATRRGGLPRTSVRELDGFKRQRVSVMMMAAASN